jgi:hypothetical protein
MEYKAKSAASAKIAAQVCPPPALHFFALARAHELHTLAERCSFPTARTHASQGPLSWVRMLARRAFR